MDVDTAHSLARWQSGPGIIITLPAGDDMHFEAARRQREGEVGEDLARRRVVGIKKTVQEDDARHGSLRSGLQHRQMSPGFGGPWLQGYPGYRDTLVTGIPLFQGYPCFRDSKTRQGIGRASGYSNLTLHGIILCRVAALYSSGFGGAMEAVCRRHGGACGGKFFAHEHPHPA